MKRPSKPSTETRKPLLIDRFMASTHRSLVNRNVVDRIKGRLRAARRFVLDDEATRRYADVIETIPELIARHQRFARAPYDVTWIEFNFEQFWKQINKRPVDDTADQIVGFLIDHGRAYVLSGRHDDSRCSLTPFAYDLHTPWSVEDQLAFCTRNSMSGLDAFFWGSAYDKLDIRERESIRNLHRAFLLPMEINDPTISTAILAGMAQETVGDIRNIITILLLLNRPSLTHYARYVPTHRGFIGNKLRAFFDHTVVSISIDPKPTLRLLGSTQGEGVSRRRHEVRGHYVHDRTARDYASIAGCIHEWQTDPHPDDDPADPDHWKCTVCGGKRWWRVEHLRGSSNVGFVQKDYNVTE